MTDMRHFMEGVVKRPTSVSHQVCNHAPDLLVTLLSFQNIGISQTGIAFNSLSEKRNKFLSVSLEIGKVRSLANCHSTVVHFKHVPDAMTPIVELLISSVGGSSINKL